MSDVRIFNLKEVGKGALKATISVDFGMGVTVHDCKIIEQDGEIIASLPQKVKRVKGGPTEYSELIEFEDPSIWEECLPKILDFYREHAQ